MNKNKIKRFAYSVILSLFAVLIIFATCFSTMQPASATYFSDNEYDTAKLELMRTYWEAAKKCAGSSKMKSMSISLSSRSATNNEYMMNFYNLNSSRLFDTGSGSGNSNLLYSEYLESEFGSKHDDGKLWCSEINIFPTLLKALNIYTDDMRNNLICNGHEPGMFSVTTGYGYNAARFGAKYDNDGDGKNDWPAGWPEDQNDCSGNLAKLIEYVEKRPDETIEGSGNGNHGYEFNVKIEPTSNAAQYFNNKISPYVGTWNDWSGNYTEMAMNHWRYRQNFEVGCLGGAKIGGAGASILPPADSTNNKIGVYDVVSGYIYYYNKNDIHFNDKQYLHVENSGQMTCGELAEKLKPSFVSNSGPSVYYAQIMRRDSIEECISKYKEGIQGLNARITDYKKMQVYANGLKDSIDTRLKNIKDGAFPAESAGPLGEYVYFDKVNYINMLDTFYYEKLHAGINGSPVYNDELLSTLISAYKDILNSTIISDNQTTITEKPDDNMMNEFNKLVEQWKDEIARIDKEIFAAENYYDEHKDWPDKKANDTKGKIWDIEAQETNESKKYVPVCPGIDTLKEETKNIFSAAPPNIDVGDWSYTPVNGMPDTNGGSYTEAKSCLSSGGAQSLGWILCPVLDVVARAAETIYDEMLEPALQVEPTLFTENGDNNGTRIGWETFRNFANILFVIFLLAVIFSQLTGYGIDNYGIKKILPKLIVVAILVNLSYFICTAMVDLSNILGNSLQEMFLNMDPGPAQKLDVWGAVESGVSTITVTALIGVILAGGIWAAIETGGAVMILIGLLMGAISVLVAFLFLFILLAAREMAIVILVVISPIAIVCYALPNTKNLFDKYKKLWQSLLLVYPIAGLLVGGGDYVSRLMLSNGAGGAGFATGLTAMLAGIIPVFFIPSVLKGSLNMMGQLGSKISGFGKSMGAKYTGNLDKGIKSTDRYKNYQDMRARDKRLNEANRNIRRLRGQSELSDKQKKLLAQSMNTVASERETDALRDNLINGGFDARMAGADAKADAQRVADIESMISNGRINVNGQAVAAGTNGAVNPNDMSKGANSLSALHAAALARHARATTAEEKSNAMAQIRAVQNMMSKTDAGRAAVMSNLSNAVARAQNAAEASTSTMAAAHLMSDFGDLYKTKNRGAHSMISDLSTGEQLSVIQDRIRDGIYDAYGVDKYTEETLAGADDAALDNLISAMNPLIDANGNMIRGASLTGKPLETLQNTAYQALEKSKAGTLNIKPEVVAKLEQIRNGYVPQSATQAQNVQQQAQATQDNILQELQDINAQLHNQNRNNNGTNP